MELQVSQTHAGQDSDKLEACRYTFHPARRPLETARLLAAFTRHIR